jgi:transcriptional regulator with XRE-family HTH domain
MPMKVQDKIRFMRESKNLSQADVADKIGLTTGGYAKVERGETKMTYQRLEKIASVLNMDIVDLLNLGERGIACLIADNSGEGTQHNNCSHNGNNATDLTISNRKT